MRLHLKPQLGHLKLVRLDPQDVRNFLHERLDAGFSTKTVKHLRDALRGALNMAVRDGKLYRNVAQLAKPPEVETRALQVYTPDEARCLIASASGTRLEALITAATAMGLRSGECLGLQWPDIDFERGTILVAHNLQRVKRVRRGDTVKPGEPKTERLLGSPKGKRSSHCVCPLSC